MSVLSTTDKVTQLQKRSDDALSIFKTTIKKLADTSKEARFTKGKKVEQIGKLQGEVDQLDAIVAKNDKVVNKINEFLEI